MEPSPLEMIGKSILKDASPPIGRAIGNTAESLIMSIFGNRAARWRIENLASESLKCMETLRERGVTNAEQLRELLPKFGLLFVEQASLEDNETLQGVWANLLANALDPQKDFSGFHNAFMDVIRGLSPIDAQLLKHFFQLIERERLSRAHMDFPGAERHFLDSNVFVMRWVLQAVPISSVDYVVAVQNLLRLQIMKYRERHMELTRTMQLKQYIPNEDEIHFTAFGYLFVKTCLG